MARTSFQLAIRMVSLSRGVLGGLLLENLMRLVGKGVNLDEVDESISKN